MALQTLKRLLPDQHPLRLWWHRSKACAAALRYGFPARHLTVIGMTGTDGKTTTVGMTAHILQGGGFHTGALSTAFFRVGETVEWNATQKTSPSPFVIQAFLRRLVREGCTHAVLEYSSHGLVQGRMTFTWPVIAGITNIAEEHLDYHGTMERYIDAKAQLFRMLPARRGTKVLNANDRTYDRLRVIPTARTIAFSAQGEPAKALDGENLWTTNIHAAADQTTATVHTNRDNQTYTLTLPIPGSFNVENALCAIGCAQAAGINTRACIDALADFAGMPGRMERIDEGQPFHVFVDFTVTPQSYEKTLGTLRSALPEGGRLLVLAGSCGDRMREKRPIVGAIVSRYADIMVITNEDPYTEDPETIIDEVWAGVDTTATEAHRRSDRREAIGFLLQQAQPNDIVVFCGKGSDTTMWVKQGQIPWNERAIVRQLLRDMVG